jgi:uncharacterized protein
MNAQYGNQVNAERMQSFFAILEQQGVAIPSQYKEKIEEKLNKINSYEPKVGVFGKTGVGKSSLCNALFGQDICEISDIKSCTREPKEIFLSIGGSGLKLLDVPGVGESGIRDKEYEELYEQLLPELDLIFWVLKGDDRAFSSDEQFYKRLVRPYVKAGKPFFVVINQIDKIEPFREWDEEKRMPSAKQSKNIEEKRIAVSGFFELNMAQVLAVSANERYGLIELVDSIVHMLPNSQKLIVLEKIKKAEDEKIKAEEAKAKAEEAKARAEEANAKARAEEARARATIEIANARCRAEEARAKAATEEARAKAIVEQATASARAKEAEARVRAEEAKAAEARDRAMAKAAEAKAQAERARAETIISERARAEAKKGWWDVAVEVVAETVGSVVEATASLVSKGYSFLKSFFK